jgi:O-antigen/teichoic acid export membrane protein
MSEFKNKALNSTFWSFFETFGNQGLQFIIGIILARLLLPEDYGIIGVLAIFMGISGVLVDSGFKTSIIRSKDITDIDCSTIFYVNFSVSIIVGLLLFASAGSLADFFKKPELIDVTRVFALIPIINGFGLVQSAILYKNLQFKRNAKASISSNVIAGIIAIFLAYKGFSYWALVWRAIVSAGVYNILLWTSSTWHPQLVFSIEILKKHFRFSSKLLLTGMVDTFFNNIYSFVFGKFFSFKDLGFFTRGKGYVDMITKTLSIAIQKVNIPILASAGKDQTYIIGAHTRLLRATTLLIFPATALLVAVAEPMILFLIGEKWHPAVPYLQILALEGMIYPVLNANSGLVTVLGRSDYILKAALISRPIQILILLITINISPIAVAWGFVLHYFIVFLVSYYFVKQTIHQSIIKMLQVLIVPFLLALTMGLSVFVIGILLKNYLPVGIVFGVQTLLGISITILLFTIFRIKEYDLIKNTVVQFISRTKSK